MTDGETCGKPPGTEKNKEPMCKISQCSSWLSTSIIHGGNRWCAIHPNKRHLSILYHCMERLLAKRWAKKRRQSFLLIKDNIWHAESINKTLFKASRLSSHGLFKRLEKMLAIIYFHLLSEISLYTGKESWRQRWREHVSFVSWNDGVQMAWP